jgi:hypothetical protein
MENIMGLINWCIANWANVLAAFGAILFSIVVFLRLLVQVFVLIPGPQPEGWLQTYADAFQTWVDKIKAVSKK